MRKTCKIAGVRSCFNLCLRFETVDGPVLSYAPVNLHWLRRKERWKWLQMYYGVM